MSDRTWALALLSFSFSLSAATAVAGPHITHPLPKTQPAGPIRPPLLADPTVREPVSLAGLPIVADPTLSGLEIPLGHQLAETVPTTAARAKVQPPKLDLLADGFDGRIPEPASLVLLVTGIVGLTARREIRRRRLKDAEAS
ncbi:MAG TPA: PEP-CTERM sorting domain-containing protein [Isosphaeraceae bacterium]|jgi:hypothetical protein|nr:PEP-CTERM sorting domain-containing protein [Isosphaeraceae bacterium]